MTASVRMPRVGNYMLHALIGRGATSDVYAAEHQFLGEPAAVKLLRGELASDRAAIDEFIAEATKTRAIQHPSVVRVLDFGRDEAAQRCYLVMERVNGESLAARISRERLPEAEVRRLGAAIADGMQAVHDAGIVHRDLKPANVMLDGERPKIVDFGIAKVLGRESALATSRRVGTLAYMAPEQLTGGLIAPYVDVWALGVILFEAATGRLPFDDFADGRCPQLFEVAPRAAGLAPISAALDRVIAGCLERDPGRRPPAMADVARALRGELAAERITEDAGPIASSPLMTPVAGLMTPVAEPARAPMPATASRRWWPFAAGSGAGIAAAAVIAIASVDSPPAPAIAAPVTAPAPVSPAIEAPIAAPIETPAVAPPPAEIAAAAPKKARSARPAALAVHIRSNPAGAQILVDGRPRGETPQRLELPKPATITVRRDGYQPAQVRAKRSGPITVKLVPCSNPLCEGLK